MTARGFFFVSAVINHDRPLTQGCHFSRHETTILPRLYPWSKIKSLSAKRRSWAKKHKYNLSGDDRINADLIIRRLVLVNFEIQQTTLLAWVSKVAIRSPKSLRRVRQVLHLCLLEATTLPFDPQKSLIGTERRKGAFCKYWCMQRFAHPRKISSGHKGD